jgi:hypothetical protein
VVRIRGEAHEAGGFELVCGALHGLAREPMVRATWATGRGTGAIRDGAITCQRGARQPEIADERVPGGEQAPVEAEDLQDQVGDGFGGHDALLRYMVQGC